MEDEADLLQLYHMIKRRKWLVAAIIMLAIIISAILSLFVIAPIYEADVTMIIGKEETFFVLEDPYTKSDVELYLKVAETYKGIAKSRRVRHKAEALLSGDEFKQIKEIKVEAKSSTQLLTIRVSHLSPEAAVLCADALAESLIEVVGEMMPASELSILDRAEKPNRPVSPNHVINVMTGLFIGGVASIGIAILLGFINHPIEPNQNIGNVSSDTENISL